MSNRAWDTLLVLVMAAIMLFGLLYLSGFIR